METNQSGQLDSPLTQSAKVLNKNQEVEEMDVWQHTREIIGPLLH